MSREDADSIRRAYEVWNESGPAAVTDQFWAEDAVYREGPGWPNAGVCFRIAGVRRTAGHRPCPRPMRASARPSGDAWLPAEAGPQLGAVRTPHGIGDVIPMRREPAVA